MTDLNLINDDAVQLHKDPYDIYQTTIETLKKYSVMVVKDDMKSWQKTDCASTSGKPLLIDQADYLTQHIFFDD
jgi:hypothetical protein